MPFTRVLIHAVWGTKDRYPFLTQQKLSLVINHIKENAILMEFIFQISMVT